MKTISFTEFRQHASSLLSDVEKGETLLVERHGHPIAEIRPVSSATGQMPSWQKPGLRLSQQGAELAAAILEDRE